MKRRWWWGLYGLGTVVVLLSLAWISALVVRLERAELDARAQNAHQDHLRLALWRMDSWFAARLAREAARPFFDYEPFYPQQRAYTRLLYEIQPGEVLLPSALLTFQSDIIQLHFQRSSDGVLRSPQVPQGNLRDLAETQYLHGDRVERNARLLDSVADLLGMRSDLDSCVDVGEIAVADNAAPALNTRAPVGKYRDTPEQQAMAEWARRAQQQAAAQTAVVPKPQQDEPSIPSAIPAVDVGPFVALWTGGGSEPGELIFVRRVRVADGELIQGFLCDWITLRGHLLEQVLDLFPSAWLQPVPDEVPGSVVSGTMMASIPAAMIAAAPPAPVALLSPARSTLILSACVVLAGLIAAALALRASISFGERRSRFASAVTHELRTPLTTFQMYTEMLAEDMVPDEAKRRVYLRTLMEESRRLATLVENVLSYARLEDGRHRGRRQRTTVTALLQQLAPALQRRAEAASMSLALRCGPAGEETLESDPDAIGQILFNLVDNACKYAADASDRTILVEVTRNGRHVLIDVCDHGPGIDPDQSRRLFTPFERGAGLNGEIPGIGLGLALCRGLAHDLRGDLVLLEGAGPGARFRLTLPCGKG